MTISQALNDGYRALTGSETPKLDSQLLLCHVLNCKTIYLHSQAQQNLTDVQQQLFATFISQRQQGTPVSHLIGEQGFWTLDLKITSATLIPRPDTELLVELALDKLAPEMQLVDLGTGSGAIALALAHEQPETQIFAMDRCAAALAVARYNAEKHHISNVIFWQGKWLAAIAEGSFDIIVSNPPYIKSDDPHLLEGDVRFEPTTALVSGYDGLDDIRIIVKQAQRGLKPSGWLLVEHGFDQAQSVQMLFQQAGFTHISSHQDLGRNDRVVIGQKYE